MTIANLRCCAAEVRGSSGVTIRYEQINAYRVRSVQMDLTIGAIYVQKMRKQTYKKCKTFKISSIFAKYIGKYACIYYQAFSSCNHKFIQLLQSCFGYNKLKLTKFCPFRMQVIMRRRENEQLDKEFVVSFSLKYKNRPYILSFFIIPFMQAYIISCYLYSSVTFCVFV